MTMTKMMIIKMTTFYEEEDGDNHLSHHESDYRNIDFCTCRPDSIKPDWSMLNPLFLTPKVPLNIAFLKSCFVAYNSAHL